MTPADLLRGVLASDARVAVTGASGWFGATALDLLSGLWGKDAPDRVIGYASSEREITLPSGRRACVRALPRLLDDPPPTVLLHFAYLTRDRVSELSTADYVATNVQLSATALAAVRRHRPRLVVTASSGAVYEPDGSLAHDVSANPYGALKVLDELAFAAAAREVGAGWAIPRVFAVAGAGITKPEKYALGSMIAMARAGGPIEIQAAQPVFRSYCGVDEVIALAVWAAARRGAGVFDTGGHVVEMADLAAATSRVIGGGCAVTRPRFDAGAEPSRYVGDPTAFDELVEASGLHLASLDELLHATTGEIRSS